MKALTMTAGAVIACMLAGCASAPPVELKNARAAYQDAAQSQGAGLASTSIYEAKKSLDRAEIAYSEDGDAAETRDLAYVAERNAVIAKANGNTMMSMQAKQLALQDAQRIKQQQEMALRQELERTKAEFEQQQRLTSEQQARIRALGAKAEERGLVLTISGSVLFATGKSTLLPGATKRLDDVVKALKDDPRDLKVIGHTDSQGAEDMNMALSRKRAEAVRTYLVTHGLPENRVTADGEGEQNPIADNKTAEGRANNRRVEIIVNVAPANKQPMPGSGQQSQEPGMKAPAGAKEQPMQPGGTQIQLPPSGANTSEPKDSTRETAPKMQTRPPSSSPQPKP